MATPRTPQPSPNLERTATHPLRMLLLVTGFLLAALYVTIVVSTDDWLWFLPHFDARPDRIIIYHGGGKRTELRAGQEGFSELASAIQTCLSSGAKRPSGIGFSDASLLDAYTRFLTVEAFFDRPVQLHAWFDTEEATQMLFPITGRHSDLSLVLLGNDGTYLSSPPVLDSIEPLREALHELGYEQ